MTIIIIFATLYLFVKYAEVRGMFAILVVCAAIAGYVNVNHTGEQRVERADVSPAPARLPDVIELGQVKHIIMMEAPPPEEPAFEHEALIEE